MRRKGQEGVPDGYKRCSKCGEVKSVGEFGRSKKSKDCLTSWCKSCHNNDARTYRKNNAEVVNNRKREYRKRNSEKIKTYIRENSDKIAKRNAVYYIKNKDKINLYAKEYSIKYRKNHPEVSIEYAKRNLDKIREYRKVYYKSNDLYICATTFFNSIGFLKKDVPIELIDAKINHLKLIRAIKAQKEGHKEVTNG